MATASLFQAFPLIRESKLQSLKWKSAQLPLRLTTKNSTNSIKFPTFCSKDTNFSVQCVKNSKKWSVDLTDKERNPFKFEGAVEKTAIAAAILGILFMYDLKSALAASGGRMGGRCSSSSSRSSSSHSSSSHSSSSRSSPSRSYYSEETSSPSVSYHSSTTYAPSYGGAGLLYDYGPLFFVGVLVVVFTFASMGNSAGSHGNQWENKTSVIKLQVCLLGMARSLQRDLNQIAAVADTSTSQGLNYILQETVLALLRHPDCCISAYSSVDVKGSTEEWERCFDRLSIEERGNFDEETLVNVNNIKRKKDKRMKKDFRNQYIVITILVAATGAQKFPLITSCADLKEALQQLGSISSSKITAVEVLWTPQEENDTLSEQELLEDYPHLRPLQDGLPNILS